ncbi:hypothetical protein [Ornithinimicrobium sediminis]|uniref:hypothetical protein n=1 Tax=Ornithinimicrobium sediminis TaxID=2904603 RepID=UPI001E36FB55|nr:hypothetical protein [Ornithinimicrobium sediminis]MCE0485678.1 hypothetical protein [Ornithinimicrobium sediminis]
MPPSSLIFVVILAVWAAYLVQHWVRRRDHIATARSVDRFSEAMRVLERRQRMPHTDISRPAPRSYAVSPIRPASPEVVVKHASPSVLPSPAAAADPHDVDALARATSGPALAPTGPGSAPARPDQPRPAAARPAAARPAAARPAAARPAAAASRTRPAAQRRSAPRVSSPLSSVNGRLAALLLSSLAMVLGTVLGMLGVWPWWTAAAGIAAFVLTGVMARRSVARAARSTARPVRRPTARPATAPARPSAARPATPVDARPAATTPGPVRPVGASATGSGAEAARAPRRPGSRPAATALGGAAAALAARSSTPARPATGGATAARRASAGAVFDIDLVESRQPVRRPQPSTTPARPVAQTAPGSWQPVPVPPPTYTLKAKAHQRPTEQVTAPAPASTPQEDLPFDGLALGFAEESEELPAVRTQP